MNERRAYALNLRINDRQIDEVVIDPHYDAKHPDVSGKLILELVKELDGKEFQPDERGGEWEFFMPDRLERQGKQYRLICCMRNQCSFIGVMNCFRR